MVTGRRGRDGRGDENAKNGGEGEESGGVGEGGGGGGSIIVIPGCSRWILMAGFALYVARCACNTTIRY